MRWVITAQKSYLSPQKLESHEVNLLSSRHACSNTANLSTQVSFVALNLQDISTSFKDSETDMNKRYSQLHRYWVPFHIIR